MPESAEVKVVAAKSRQRTVAKRATLEKMRGKKPAQKEFTIKVNGEELGFLFVSIGNTAYDKLLSECPATTEQMSRGLQTDTDKLAPRLLSRVCIDPELSEEEWAELWRSKEWSRGEMMTLYNEAGMLCIGTMDITPTVAG